MAIKQFSSAFPGGYTSGFERNLAAAEGWLDKVNDVNNKLYAAKMQKTLVEEMSRPQTKEQEALLETVMKETDKGNVVAAQTAWIQYEEDRKQSFIESMGKDKKKKGFWGTLSTIASPFVAGLSPGSEAANTELEMLTKFSGEITKKYEALKRVEGLLPPTEKITLTATQLTTARRVWEGKREDIRRMETKIGLQKQNKPGWGKSKKVWQQELSILEDKLEKLKKEESTMRRQLKKRAGYTSGVGALNLTPPK